MIKWNENPNYLITGEEIWGKVHPEVTFAPHDERFIGRPLKVFIFTDVSLLYLYNYDDI